MKVLAEEGTNQMIEEIKKLKDTSTSIAKNSTLWINEWKFWQKMYNRFANMPQNPNELILKDQRDDGSYISLSSEWLATYGQEELDICTCLAAMGIAMGLYEREDYKYTGVGSGPNYIVTYHQAYQISQYVYRKLSETIASSATTYGYMTGIDAEPGRVSDLAWMLPFMKSLQNQS